jgi:hypothetical protein
MCALTIKYRLMLYGQILFSIDVFCCSSYIIISYLNIFFGGIYYLCVA